MSMNADNSDKWLANLDSGDIPSGPRDDPRRSRAVLWLCGGLIVVALLAGGYILSRPSNESVSVGKASPSDLAIEVTINGTPVSAGVVDGSMKRELAAHPELAADRELLGVRTASSAALEELLVEAGRSTAKVSSEQVDSEIKNADSVYPVGGTPPSTWTEADRDAALKDPEVRATVERILYRTAGLTSVLKDLPANERTAETTNAIVAKWFSQQLNNDRVTATVSGKQLSDQELVAGLAPLQGTSSEPQVVQPSGESIVPSIEAPPTSAP